MTEKEQWGPWVRHDGNGYPCPGAWVHLKFKSGVTDEGRAGVFEFGDPEVVGSSWHWGTGWDEIARYRIRKPRGLTILDGTPCRHRRAPARKGRRMNRTGHKWTETETADLIRRLEENQSHTQIAAALNRTEPGVRSYVSHLRNKGVFERKREGVQSVQVSNSLNGRSLGRTKVSISMPRAPWEEAM